MDSVTLDSGETVAEGDEFRLAEHVGGIGMEAGTTLSVVGFDSVGDRAQVEFDTEDGPVTMDADSFDALLADEAAYRVD
jgi:hypothetical protein